MLADITLFFCFLHDTATTEIYTLSLHDALPISNRFRKHVSAATPARKNTTTSVAVNTGGTILVVPIVTRAILPKADDNSPLPTSLYHRQTRKSQASRV